MDDDEFDNPVLMHYASKYYDPVKAREYYLKTRELKGREPGQAEELSKESRQKQSEATAYVKNAMSTENRTANQQASEAQKARLEKLRNDAQASKKAIMDKIEARLAQIKSDTTKKREAALASIPKPKLRPIPEHLPEKRKAFLREQNNKLSQAYNNRVSRATAKVNTEIKAENDKFRGEKDAARAEVRQIGENLKAAVTQARESYAAAKQARAETYKSTLNSELTNIRDNVR